MTTGPMGPWESMCAKAGAFAGGCIGFVLSSSSGFWVAVPATAGGATTCGIFGRTIGKSLDIFWRYAEIGDKTLDNFNNGVNEFRGLLNNGKNAAGKLDGFGTRVNSVMSIFNGGILLGSGLTIYAVMGFAGVNCNTECTRDIELIQYAYTTLVVTGVAFMILGGIRSIF